MYSDVKSNPIHKESPLLYQNNLFLLEMQKHENQQLLNEFEEKNLN
jgi:hypothetical protein